MGIPFEAIGQIKQCWWCARSPEACCTAFPCLQYLLLLFPKPAAHLQCTSTGWLLLRGNRLPHLKTALKHNSSGETENKDVPSGKNLFTGNDNTEQIHIGALWKQSCCIAVYSFLSFELRELVPFPFVMQKTVTERTTLRLVSWTRFGTWSCS